MQRNASSCSVNSSRVGSTARAVLRLLRGPAWEVSKASCFVEVSKEDRKEPQGPVNAFVVPEPPDVFVYVLLVSSFLEPHSSPVSLGFMAPWSFVSPMLGRTSV